MSDAPLLVMAAGGTGGHMFPAQSLAEAMLARGWRVKLSTDERGARYTAAFPSAVEIEVLPSATFARGGIVAKVIVPFRILAGVISALGNMRRNPPTVVVGFGGYPSIPALSAAWLKRLPRMIHEQNGVLGRVNRIFAARVQHVACGVWPTALPSGSSGIHVGNPVRETVLSLKGAEMPIETQLEVLVMGGSQGARILSDHVPSAFAELSDELKGNLKVHHQARAEDNDRVVAAYSEAGVQADVQPFFADAPELMQRSTLVISRAGASSVADISVIGRPSILIPFAAAMDDHQTANARGLVDAGGAIAIPERDVSAELLAAEITGILQDADKARGMAQAALAYGRPNAASDLADLVEKAAGRDRT